MTCPTMTTPALPPEVIAILGRLTATHLDEAIARDAAALITRLAGSQVPDAVTVCLITNTITRRGVSVVVSPNQAVVMSVLTKKCPNFVSVHDLGVALWGSGIHKSVNTVRVMMTYLRDRLVPINATIQNRHGYGYRLELAPITSEVTK